MAKPRWHHILLESQRHALKAVDEWNSSGGNFLDFVAHMHRAWHYLLHAKFHKDGTDYRYIDPNTKKHVISDGEPKAWSLDDCVEAYFLDPNGPVRLNIKFFIRIRNKAEHRYAGDLRIVAGGKAQSLVLNYEREMVSVFGSAYSLADRLRFPIHVSDLTVPTTELAKIASTIPQRTRDIVARFEAGIAKETLDDLRYDYRIRLVPIVGPKTSADLAVNFVNLDSLSDAERKTMVDAGRTGTVIVRDKHVEVAGKGKLRPHQVVSLVQKAVPFEFTLYAHHTVMWQRLKVRPATAAANPYGTDQKYCVYDEPYKSYLYTQAWVERILKTIGTPSKFQKFFGYSPRPLSSGGSTRP